VRRLFAWIARWLGRRRARALLAAGLPRGLDGARLRGSLRVPREQRSDGFATVLLGAQIVRGEAPRILLRLPALPPPPPDLGKAHPDRFRLDGDLRLPPERDAARTAADAPPVDHAWLNPALKREKVDLPWMAQNRLFGLAPRPVEWFVLWWDGTARRPAGAQDPKPWPVPDDLPWLMDEVKEQMLIRRDVVKDEHPPKDGAFLLSQSGPSIASHEPPPVPDLLPEKEWVETFSMARASPQGAQPVREAVREREMLLELLRER
jgi:hypothetical protein